MLCTFSAAASGPVCKKGNSLRERGDASIIADVQQQQPLAIHVCY
jgi:hypothetical protein